MDGTECGSEGGPGPENGNSVCYLDQGELAQATCTPTAYY